MTFRRLLPDPGDVELEALLAELDFARRAPAERPHTVVNFVASADGRATIAGRSGQLGDDGDRAMFHGLRERVDAVLAGTSTLEVERYGRMIRDPALRRRRIERGLAAEPLACVVTRSGKLPAHIPLLAEPDAQVIVFSPTEIDLAGFGAQVEVVRVDPGQLTLVTVLRRLRAEHGVRCLLCEGGPTLFGALLQEGVVDELFLTLAPKLAGGGRGPAITSGPELSAPTGLKLAWALERAGSLYLRYALER